ncbi:hypothetical protein [Staphylococcus phage SaGU1]|uniref:Uncharacterized protein n=7 Tax=Kayvirus TaxID=1857843 RepID=A0A7G7WVG3_9CAUD|nr:hypothetical protein F360_gp007 [Staphylococcus phage G15]YP_009099466.1 hypothetical protein P108_0129 [Staphylococcus phage P108]ARQ95974.1 hypothetical protein qdsa002_17 [Staphylococcus phage qdsa002]AUG85657.1 hypothetical protein HSA30_gp153 [Staphylococcus phage HSA30]QEQ93177.1 hypothetical protein [Staphylococcus phage vB_SauH_IME522]QNH71207.1 hypothetical protein StAP1_075 [Staphylococcus phage vB_SauH_SAP1]QZQ75013.1 hypothetical protein [Staphylococcus phage vB_ScoM-PSC1]UQJ9
MFKLQNKVEIIVPKEDNNGVEIADKRIKEYVNSITMEAGGCTITEIKGQWYSEDEKRIMEDNNLNLEWYYLQDSAKFMTVELKGIVRRLIEVYGQEAISIKVNGTLYIVDQSDIEELHTTLLNIMK